MLENDYFKKGSSGVQLANKIRYDIISGKLERGSITSENLIADRYEVSRSPVREALKTLNEEGLLIQRRTGIEIIGMSSKNIEEIYEVREMIEIFCIKKCMQRGGIEELKLSLKYHLMKMEKSLKKGNLVQLTIEDILFHEQVIIESGHSRALSIWKGIKDTILMALLISNEKKDKKDYTNYVYRHLQLIELLDSENIFKIKQYVHEHYQETTDYLISIYGRE